MIVIVDYNMGNILSVQNMLKKIGYQAIITSDAEVVNKAEKIILPGVGAFDRAMKNIESLGLLEVLNYKALKEKVPILGICLGMQLLTKSSEEGQLPGLGYIYGHTQKFVFSDTNWKIPHMGWNEVKPRISATLFKNLDSDSRFYHVHSYYVVCENDNDIAATTSYGIDFTSSIEIDNIFGTQFHPEKSHKFGKQLLSSFCQI